MDGWMDGRETRKDEKKTANVGLTKIWSYPEKVIAYSDVGLPSQRYFPENGERYELQPDRSRQLGVKLTVKPVFERCHSCWASNWK